MCGILAALLPSSAADVNLTDVYETLYSQPRDSSCVRDRGYQCRPENKTLSAELVSIIQSSRWAEHVSKHGVLDVGCSTGRADGRSDDDVINPWC